MKILKISVVAILSILMLNSCKKGEDDPFFSFLTRKMRLTGEWTLKSADYEETETFSDTNSTGVQVYVKDHYIYDGSKYSLSTSFIGGIEKTEYLYSEDLNINKDGTYIIDIIKDSTKTAEEGFWTWINKNKELELKNKEAVLLSVTKSVNSWGTNTYSGKSIYPDDMMVFKKLTNDEFVIQFDYSEINGFGYKKTLIGTMTYIKTNE